MLRLSSHLRRRSEKLYAGLEARRRFNTDEGVLLLMDTAVLLFVCRTFVPIAKDHQLTITGRCLKNRFFFLLPQKFNRKPLRVSRPPRLAVFTEKAFGTKKWHNSGNSETWLSGPEAEAEPLPSAALWHDDDLPAQCRDAGGGALPWIRPSKGPEDLCLMSFHKSRPKVSARLGLPAFTPSWVFFTAWPGSARRIWRRRGWSGPRRAPAPPAVPCLSPPHGKRPPRPRLREIKKFKSQC